jgi:hypothetical protein
VPAEVAKLDWTRVAHAFIGLLAQRPLLEGWSSTPTEICSKIGLSVASR